MTGRVHALTILLGSFLLFQIQPLLTKWILPWFGGGPEIWTACAVFFQVALFAGYLYAHLVDRLPRAARLAVHLALVAAAAFFLPVAPGDRWRPSEPGTGAILLLLAATVGVPFLLLSSTGPLVQAWFARACPDRSPYRLFALSNAGSLAALLTYPFLIEPRMGLRMQSWVWTGTFAAFAALQAAGAILAKGDAPPQTGRPRLLWILLPAFASAMLLATTNQLSQEVAVLPFLWILPLALYLASFIVAFDHPRWFRPGLLAPATAVLGFGAALAYYLQPRSPAGVALGIVSATGVLFGVCLLCHGATAALKPEPGRLTGYYLSIAGGGAAGGLLVALVAPRVFSSLFEWKLGVGISTAAALAAAAWDARGFLRAHLNVAALLFVIAVVGFAFQAALLASWSQRLHSARNFYGVVAVDRTSNTHDLIHGRVLHGRQYIDERHRRTPMSYYVEASGVGRVLEFYRGRPEMKVGVVGLGSGTLAAYGTHASQVFRFYEINPEVERIARRHFTYLQDCRGKVEVVAGDARLSLDREPAQGFHVLALDAFTSHSVPTHLLTAEAMAIYARHLAPGGAVVFHISNHFLDLEPVVRGAARRSGLTSLRVDYVAKENEPGVSSSWMVCTSNEALLRSLGEEAPGRPEREWTDDASDLFSILKRK